MKLCDIVENQHRLKVPEYPKDVMLKGGFYMVRGSTHDNNVTWFVHLLMEDEEKIYAIVRMDVGNNLWIYKPLIPENEEMWQTPVSPNFFKLDKFKEFVIERLHRERLIEVFDTPGDFNIENASRTHFSTAAMIGKREAVFGAKVDDDWTWEIGFGEMQGGVQRTIMTGSRNEFEVGAFVKASFLEFMRRYNPIFISFTADTPNRQKIYTRIFGRLMPAWKYRVEDAGKAGKRYIYSQKRP